MSHTERRNWLIAYDIANPKRLLRVHRYLKKHAIPVQYSVFVLHGSQLSLENILAGISSLIAPEEDDVRAYHLPQRCEVTMLGRQSFPEGVMLAASGLDKLLRELTVSEPEAIVEGV
jgi:CRISPR-associated protein Cas2